MRNYDYLKDNYLEARNMNSNGNYTATQIAALCNMAERDIYPDNRFSDEECSIWEMFYLFKIKGKE